MTKESSFIQNFINITFLKSRYEPESSRKDNVEFYKQFDPISTVKPILLIHRILVFS